MHDDDLRLLADYVRNHSEDAFATLVSKHVNLVYSVACRQVGDPHLAEEITQAVFVILARKAAALGAKTILSGWLCRTARHVSSNALTRQHRRQRREHEAHMQSLLNEPEPELWRHIAPLLDGALDHLNAQEHDAVVLRFFEGRNYQEVGTALGTSEDAAKMRVNRALEKLRKFFSKRGVTSTTAILAGTLSTHCVQAAPAGLAQSVAVVAAAKGAAAGGSTLTLIKGALKLMAWTKMKTTSIAVLGVLLVGGTATVVVKVITDHGPLYREGKYNGQSVRYWVDQALWGISPGNAAETYQTLRHIGGPAAGLLVEALTQTNSPPGHPDFPAADVRNNAFSALSQMGASARSQVPELIELLKYDDKDVRIWATLALAGIGPAAKNAIPDLIAESQNATYTDYANEALRQIGH